MTSPQPQVICFGEILWDFLPEGLFPGGAPFNVSYHLQQQGVIPHLISGIGRDQLGDELLRRLKDWGQNVDMVERHQGLPTGTVIATLGESGDASYEITPSVAWDQIVISEDGVRAAVESQALIFGSLALRSPCNQASLDRLFAVIPEKAWLIFDVNLRPPHDDLDLVNELAPKATMLKLNNDEAARLVDGESGSPGREESDARVLAKRHGNRIVCITAGSRGAGLLHENTWYWETGREVEVSDTIGAGDSFLATLIVDLLKAQLPINECLAHACRVGEWVASQRGATPAYNSSTPVDQQPSV